MTRIIRTDERAALDLFVNGERERVYAGPVRMLSQVLRECTT